MAGSALIGALRVSLGLDSAQFEAGSKRARQTAKSDVSAIQREFDRLKNIGSTLAGVWAGSEIVAAAKRALDMASSLGEVAQQAGVTAAELQEYRYVASQVGLSNDEMDNSLKKLTRSMGEAKAGSKSQVEAFRELGGSVESAVVAGKSAGEVIPLIADALAKIEDPATRARIEVDLFGKAGQKLDTMLAGGSAAVNQLRDAAHSLGIVLSDEQIQKADETADKLAEIKQVLEARIAGVVSDNAQAIMTLADAFGYVVTQAGKAVQALVRFKAQQGISYEEQFTSGLGQYLVGDERKKLARSRIKQYRDVVTTNGGRVSDPEYLRNKSLSDARALMGYQPPANAPIPEGRLPDAPSSGRKTRGRSGPTTAEIEAKSQQELSRLRQEQLQAELSLTVDAEKRADLQSQLLLEEFNERSAQIANDEHFTVAQKAAQQAALKALYGVSGEGDSIVVGGNKNSLSAGIMRGLNEQLARQAYEAQSADLNAKKDALQGQLNLARTADERRKIELEILDLEYQLRAAKLDQVINSQESSKAEKDLAQMAKDRLGGQRAQDAANIERQTMGPLATYMDSLPKTAGEVNEAFEQIAANGLANMNDQLANAAANTLKLKGLAGQLFNQLIADVIRLNLQQAMGGGGGLLGGLVKLGTSIFGGGGLGGVSASSLSALDGQASAIQARNLTGLATGGTIGGFPGVDKNVLSINGIPTARVSANERIRVEPNSANDNGRTNIHVSVEEGALFRPVVTQISAGVAAPMSAQAAAGGSMGAQKAIARSNSRRLA